MADDLIAISMTPLDIGRITAHVVDPSAGGIAVFAGVTRGDSMPQSAGVRVAALDYEAYDEMALKQMAGLCERARQRWPVVKAAIVHRVGRVPAGEPSVVIAVSTPHRREAFEACEWLIDTLKKEVAVWKKEVAEST